MAAKKVPGLKASQVRKLAKLTAKAKKYAVKYGAAKDVVSTKFVAFTKSLDELVAALSSSGDKAPAAKKTKKKKS